MSNTPRSPRTPFACRWLVLTVALTLSIQAVFVQPASGSTVDQATGRLPHPGEVSAPSLLAQAPATPATAPRPPAAPPFSTGVTQPPPQVGAVVVEDTLTGGGLVPTGSCPSGRVTGETVGEGLLLKVRGVCTGSETVAIARTPIPGLRILDGEVRFEVKFVAGLERASLGLILRSGQAQNRVVGYGFVVGPSAGTSIFAFTEGGPRIIGLRTAREPIQWGEWNTIALRVQGNGLWLIVNDVPILSATDGGFAEGGVILNLSRSGNVNDEAETSAVLRNMRVSMLEGSDPSLSPTYEAPQAPGPSQPGGQQQPSGPPRCSSGEPRLMRDPDGKERWYCDQTDWNQQ
jgi:hypothetical protein